MAAYGIHTDVRLDRMQGMHGFALCLEWLAVHEIASSSNSCTSVAELAAAAAAAAAVDVAVAPAQAFASQPAIAAVPAAASVVPDAAVPGTFVPPAAAGDAAAGPENLEVASGQRKGLLLMPAAVAKQAGNWMGFPKRHHPQV